MAHRELSHHLQCWHPMSEYQFKSWLLDFPSISLLMLPEKAVELARERQRVKGGMAAGRHQLVNPQTSTLVLLTYKIKIPD